MPTDKKTAGRTALPPAKKIGPEFVGKTPTDLAKQESARNQQLARVGEILHADSAYDYERYISESIFFASHTATSWIELGKRLIAIKENEPIGKFIDAVENRIGIGRRAAQQSMQAAIRLLGTDLHSTEFVATARLGKSKAIELLVLDDDELKALEEGESIAGLNLDKIDRMSVRELRKELRKIKGKIEAEDKRAKQREEEIERLNEALIDSRNFLKTTKPDKIATQLMIDLSVVVTDQVSLWSRFREGVDTICAHGDKHGIDFMADIDARFISATDGFCEMLSYLRLKGINGPADRVLTALGEG